MTDRALLIGINKYPGAPLAGCVPDIKRGCCNLSSEALQKAGLAFDWAELAACTDDRAHAYGMLSRLERMTANAKPGDRLLFWFSGHGARIADRGTNGEVDGYFESLCPVNFDYDDRSSWITDSDFKRLFSSVPIDARCYIILDSCFSGGMSESVERVVSHREARCYPGSDRVDFEVRRRAAISRELTLRGITSSVTDRVAVVSACLESQTAADAVINGEPNGAFTYFFWESFLNNIDQPLISIVALTSDRLGNAGYPQIPTIAGPDWITEPFLSRG